MAETIDLEKKREARRRLALLALAGEQSEPSGPCLEAEELACLVEGRLTPEQIEACLAHLAGCEHCYATWRHLDQEWQQQQAKRGRRGKLRQWLNRPRLLTAAGSLLAAAASIAVFINFTTRLDRQALLRFPTKPAQEQVQAIPPSEPLERRAVPQEQPAAPAPPLMQAKQREQKTLSGTAPVPATEQEAAGAAKAPARGADRAATVQPSPTPTVSAPLPQNKVASADQLMSKKENAADGAIKEGAPAPARPEQALRAGSAVAPQRDEAAPLTLAGWRQRLREGCQGHPRDDSFASLAAQGKRLLALDGKDSLTPEARQQVSGILTLLANQESQPIEQRCQAMLKLLSPFAKGDAQ
jgi:hypothetical protein